MVGVGGGGVVHGGGSRVGEPYKGKDRVGLLSQ